MSLIGNKPNQIPLCGMLGTMAFQDGTNPPKYKTALITTSSIWIKPDGLVNNTVVITLVSGGASGGTGGIGDLNIAVGGGGGGGGGSGFVLTKALTISSNLTITIGAGGNAVPGGAMANGNDGGATSVTGTGISESVLGGKKGLMGEAIQYNGSAFYANGGKGGPGSSCGQSGSSGSSGSASASTAAAIGTGGVGGNPPLFNDYGAGSEGSNGTINGATPNGTSAGKAGCAFIEWWEY